MTLIARNLNKLSRATGADNIKKYWSRYYQGSQGVVFVLDSASSDEDLEAARNELHSALQHPQLCTLPFLILANHQDKPAARTPNQVSQDPHLWRPGRVCEGIGTNTHTENIFMYVMLFLHRKHMLLALDRNQGMKG